MNHLPLRKTYLRSAFCLTVILSLILAGCAGSTTSGEPSASPTDISNPAASAIPPATSITLVSTPVSSGALTGTTTPAAKGPVFTLSNLTITPAQAARNEKVEISVLVANTGDAAGTYTVTLEINNENMGSKSVSLQAGASGTVSFTQSRDMPSTYQVKVNELSGSFTVISGGPPPITTSPAWTIPAGTGTTWRAAHMGGNWGSNRGNIPNPPEEYLQYLRDLNVNWVGISMALHYDGSMDSTVELDYDETLQIPSLRDDALRNLIRIFTNHGFKVYIHIAFEEGNTGEHPVSRWQLGDPLMHTEDPAIRAEYWPWRTDHPQHQAFITEFWQTYTDCVTHIAQIAGEEGAGALTLGTETDRLFRSRSGGRWTNNFLPQMQSMVASVRAVYHGLLSYEAHCNAITNRDFFGAGTDYIWKDLGLDFIGISAYFQLATGNPTTAPQTADLESRWNAIFNEYLIPARQRNSNLPVVFTEFGYVDSLAALVNPAADEFSRKVFTDGDGNGLDDGEEAQSNAYAALFNTMDKYPGAVLGAFLWDVGMATGQEYRSGFYTMRTFNIRLKLAEDMVRAAYERWRQ